MEIYCALPLTAHLFVRSAVLCLCILFVYPTGGQTQTVLCLCSLSLYPAGGQTRDVYPMSGYCWPTVYDAQPTLAQYWVTVGQRHRRRANINPALVQSIVTVPPTCRYFCMHVAYDRPAGMKRSPGVGTVLVHSLRRRNGVVPALGGLISCFVVMTMGDIAQWTEHWPGVDLVPGRRRRRWTGIESAV